ncbi:hypothetical protein GJ698_02085 [Pseudoduganella sp. FT26W]|uniref:Uncharacterized protein n=1 Tax=Duganella aquatilis TaxID=2666082 RepID=A0A844D6P8_9BURK|nr:hypothetical protein [Duganella aquatilis]MRW82879.1 hypothetical protein [Duganella aquatilis]
MPTIQYTCTGFEEAGDAEFFDTDGNYQTALHASRCFADWYAENHGWTWKWRPGYEPSDEVPAPDSPPEDPEPAAST